MNFPSYESSTGKSCHVSRLNNARENDLISGIQPSNDVNTLNRVPVPEHKICCLVIHSA